jgi:hypothetical protein
LGRLWLRNEASEPPGEPCTPANISEARSEREQSPNGGRILIVFDRVDGTVGVLYLNGFNERWIYEKECITGPLLEERGASYEAIENDSRYSSMVR